MIIVVVKGNQLLRGRHCLGTSPLLFIASLWQLYEKVIIDPILQMRALGTKLNIQR